jgi:hypothetical protein
MKQFDFSTKARRKEAWLFVDTVWEGLDYIDQQVRRIEVERGLTDNFSYCTFGSEEGDAIVCNYFLWYANALHNFIRVFKKAFCPRENLKKEFRCVIAWRHKVAAHTSWVWPKRDSADTQNMSILLFPEVSAGHFAVGGFRIMSQRDCSRGQPFFVRVKSFLRKLFRNYEPPCPDWRWELARTHERLKEIVSKYASAV